uniref:Uncharacterized protein n=1 Tax=Romanomermis culicivorax TaxID=13658 RepID=A0A915KPR1_ROMCU
MSVQDFMINIALWTTLFLLPGAIGFPNDSITKEWYNIASAWEISDYGIFCMAFVSISIMMYTKYWLLCKCTQETYLAMWHLKYLMASYSQLFFQLMAYINVLSGVSRLTATAAMVIYYRKRSQMNKANESHHHQNGHVVKNSIHQNGTVSQHV